MRTLSVDELALVGGGDEASREAGREAGEAVGKAVVDTIEFVAAVISIAVVIVGGAVSGQSS